MRKITFKDFFGHSGQTMGYVLGTTVLFPLGLYLANKIQYTPRDVTPQQVEQFIDNSIDTTMYIPSYAFNEPEDKTGKYDYYPTREEENYLGFGFNDCETSLYGGSVDYSCYGFYSKELHKYFCILNLSERVNGMLEMFDRITVKVSINKYFRHNPDYGYDMYHPIPILKCVGVNKSLRGDPAYAPPGKFGQHPSLFNDFDTTYMNPIYRATVKEYLKHLLARKDYKKMFVH